MIWKNKRLSILTKMFRCHALCNPIKKHLFMGSSKMKWKRKKFNNRFRILSITVGHTQKCYKALLNCQGVEKVKSIIKETQGSWTQHMLIKVSSLKFWDRIVNSRKPLGINTEMKIIIKIKTVKGITSETTIKEGYPKTCNIRSTFQ